MYSAFLSPENDAFSCIISKKTRKIFDFEIETSFYLPFKHAFIFYILQIALQILQNIQNQEHRDPKEILREFESNSKNANQQRRVQQDEAVIVPQNGRVTLSAPSDQMLDEYDIISSAPSSESSKVNGHGQTQPVPVESPAFEVLVKQPRYVISKGYTAKRKDEIHLPLGTQVAVVQREHDRSYVVAFTKQNMELDRGWLPTYCLTLKEEAVEITSKEGMLLTCLLYTSPSPRDS